MEGSTTLQDRPRIRSPEEFWLAYAGIPTAAAVGLIRDLPDMADLGKSLFVDQAVGILTKIGHETDSEPNQNLRDAARLVLARHFASRLVGQMEYDKSTDLQIADYGSVDALLRFYSQHVRHSAVADRDRDHISRFLAACCRYHRTPCLRPALFTTGNYQLLSISALPQLYDLLRHDLRSTVSESPDLLWDAWVCWPDKIEGFRGDREKQVTALRHLLRRKKCKQKIREDILAMWHLCNHPENDHVLNIARGQELINAIRELLQRFDRMCQFWKLY